MLRSLARLYEEQAAELDSATLEKLEALASEREGQKRPPPDPTANVCFQAETGLEQTVC
jgi:hypothetical protein